MLDYEAYFNRLMQMDKDFMIKICFRKHLSNFFKQSLPETIKLDTKVYSNMF
jgi:hypothetical protein